MMRKTLRLLTGLALLLGLAVPAAAQSVTFELPVQGLDPVGRFITAADTDVAIAIRYVGSDAGGGEVAIETDGNLTFTVGTAAYDGFECPVSGALGGVIDVSDAACNTWGEVYDVVNASGSDFQLALVSVKRSDSSNDYLLADTIDTVDSLTGRTYFADSSTALRTAVLLAPAKYQDVRGYFNPPNPNGNSALAWNFQGQVVIQNVEWTPTYSSGTNTLNVYAIDRNGNETLIFSEGSAASTNENTFTEDIVCPRDQKCIVEVVSSAALTSSPMEVLAVNARSSSVVPR